MKIVAFNSTTHFGHPIFNSYQRLNTNTHHCLVRITRSISLQRQQLLGYQTHLISKPISNTSPTTSIPEKERNFGVDIDQNTSYDVLRLMDVLGLVVTPDIYASLVAECTRNQNAFQALKLYAHIKRNHAMIRFLNRASGLLFINRILMMLNVCGCLDIAHQLFDEMPQRDSICLAIMISGFVSNHLFDRALDLFMEMHQCLFHQPSDIAMQVVLVCVLKACVHLKNINLGKVVHGWLVKMGCGRELVGVALIRFYGKFKCLPEANSLFYEQIQLSDHCDCSIWTYAIVNNCRGGCFREAVRIFGKMLRANVRKNEYVFSSVLKACGRLRDEGSYSYGMQVHAQAIKLALDTHDSVKCGLIDMYGRCGLLNDARKVFDMICLGERNRACWNAMMAGFIRNGCSIEAIKLLYRMKAAGVQPDESLIVKLRVACGSENYGMSTG